MTAPTPTPRRNSDYRPAFDGAPMGTCRWCGRNTGDRRRRWCAPNEGEQLSACVGAYLARKGDGFREEVMRANRAAHGGVLVCERCSVVLDGPVGGGVAWGAEADHIRALALGGTNDPSNGQVLCSTCHRTKTARDLTDIAAAREARRRELALRFVKPIEAFGGRP